MFALILSIFFILISVLYVIYKSVLHQYFTPHNNIPYNELPEFGLGSIRQLGYDKGVNTCEAVYPLYKKYESEGVFQIWFSFSNQVFITDPKYIQQVLSDRVNFHQSNIAKLMLETIFPTALIIQDGYTHKRLAKVIAPLLKKHRVIPYIKNITQTFDRCVELWRKQYTGPKNRDKINKTMFQDYSLVLMDLIGFIAFDQDFEMTKSRSEEHKTQNRFAGSENEKILSLGDSIQVIINYFNLCFKFPLPKFLKRIFLKFSPTYNKALNSFKVHIFKTLEMQKQKNLIKQQNLNNGNTDDIIHEKPNLLSLLIANLMEDEVAELAKPEPERVGLTRAELIDETAILITASYETSAIGLLWTTYWLSKHPEVQSKMREEINRLIPNKDQELDLDLISSCKYVEAVIKEVFRISPMVVGHTRSAINRVELGPYILEPGQDVMCASYFSQMNPKYWNVDPKQFNPDRFYGDEAPDSKHNPFIYLPFGYGNHACLGQALALLEIKIACIRFMQNLTFGSAPGNNGGYEQRMATMPKETAFYLRFHDDISVDID